MKQKLRIVALSLSLIVSAPMISQNFDGRIANAVESVEIPQNANPLISRDVPAYSDAGNATTGNDAFYYTQWNGSADHYLAYDLSSVDSAMRSQVILVWYNLSSFDSVGSYGSQSSVPSDYVIEVNSADGGVYPETGWETALSVSENHLSSRQHLVNMEQYNWIRLRIVKGNATINMDIHSASNGVTDSWIFLGDSITAGGMNNAYGTGYATYINQLDRRYFPVQQNGGIGGITSTDGKEHIAEWLADSPAHYVSIAYGTNDAWGNINNLDRYYENTKYMIDTVLSLGKIPVLPTIPYSSDATAGKYTTEYNAVVERLYSEYGDKLIQGADLYSFFKEYPEYLSSDGVHPNTEGYEAMRKFWAESMYSTVYQMTAQETYPSIMGDVNEDGSFTIADIIATGKWLISPDENSLANWENGDFTQDALLDGMDLILMKRALFS